eukprot:531925_1
MRLIAWQSSIHKSIHPVWTFQICNGNTIPNSPSLQLQIGPIQKIIIKKDAQQVYIILYVMDFQSIEYTRIWDWNMLNIPIFYLFKDRKDKNIYIALQISETVKQNDYEAAIIDIFTKQRLSCAIDIIIAAYGKNKSIYETQADKKIDTVFTYVIKKLLYMNQQVLIHMNQQLLLYMNQ